VSRWSDKVSTHPLRDSVRQWPGHRINKSSSPSPSKSAAAMAPGLARGPPAGPGIFLDASSSRRRLPNRYATVQGRVWCRPVYVVFELANNEMHMIGAFFRPRMAKTRVWMSFFRERALPEDIAPLKGFQSFCLAGCARVRPHG
jgi:hypothetical protein